MDGNLRNSSVSISSFFSLHYLGFAHFQGEKETQAVENKILHCLQLFIQQDQSERTAASAQLELRPLFHLQDDDWAFCVTRGAAEIDSGWRFSGRMREKQNESALQIFPPEGK